VGGGNGRLPVEQRTLGEEIERLRHILHRVGCNERGLRQRGEIQDISDELDRLIALFMRGSEGRNVRDHPG
jgi:hypothetical protein